VHVSLIAYSDRFCALLSTVRQLKAVWNAVEPYTHVRRPAAHAKKAIWVEAVHRVFYNDDACTQPNTTIVSQLPTGGESAGTAADAPVRMEQYSPARQPTIAAQARTAAAAAANAAQARAAANVAAMNAIAAAFAATAQQSQQATHPRPQSGTIGPQSLARQPQAAATHRPAAAAAAAASAAATASASRQQAQNMAMQQAAAAGFPPFGGSGIMLHPPFAYVDWMPPAFQLPPQPFAAQMPPTAASVPSTTSGQPANKKIKQEPGAATPVQEVADESYWDTRPKNPQESSMVAQLQQMGFTDIREMLTGIRHVSATDMASQVESAMMWIVSQREEAEEARKLDAARARSESLRAEQARMRKEAAHERLWGTSMDEWMSQSDLFRGSVVLKEARECLETFVFDKKENKEKLIRFLELEKKARKWYGTSVPWCFLFNLSEKWKALSEDELVKCIESEAGALETAMYSLSEQQGGVPIIFSEARRNAEKDGRPVSPGKEAASGDESDDDVIVVKEVFASESDSYMNSVSSNGKKCEVIELL